MSFNKVNQTTGALEQVAGLFQGDGVKTVSVNGVAQTVTEGAVDIDVASNLITEAQWASIASILV